MILCRSLQFLDFADDIKIIGSTTAKMCEAYTRLKREEARIGLRINVTMTKYLLAGDSIWEAVYELTATVSRW